MRPSRIRRVDGAAGGVAAGDRRAGLRSRVRCDHGGLRPVPAGVSEATQAAVDVAWMREALGLAAAAEAAGEVPVGAVLVQQGRAIGRGYNRPIGLHDPTAHAEVRALREAGQQAGNYRLPGSTLYVTLEPCLMCVGAIIHARVARLVYGATDPKTGAVHSCYRLLEANALNHRLPAQGGVLAEESAALLQRFFRARRRSAG